MGEAREESALNMFRQMDLKGKSSKDDTQLKTVHQNTIATIRSYDETGGSVRKFSSKSTMLADTIAVSDKNSEWRRRQGGYLVGLIVTNKNDTMFQRRIALEYVVLKLIRFIQEFPR